MQSPKFKFKKVNFTNIRHRKPGLAMEKKKNLGSENKCGVDHMMTASQQYFCLLKNEYNIQMH